MTAPALNAAPTPKINGNQFVHFGKIADIANNWERRSATTSSIQNPPEKLTLFKRGADANKFAPPLARKVCEIFHVFAGPMFSIIMSSQCFS